MNRLAPSQYLSKLNPSPVDHSGVQNAGGYGGGMAMKRTPDGCEGSPQVSDSDV